MPDVISQCERPECFGSHFHNLYGVEQDRCNANAHHSSNSYCSVADICARHRAHALADFVPTAVAMPEWERALLAQGATPSAQDAATAAAVAVAMLAYRRRVGAVAAEYKRLHDWCGDAERAVEDMGGIWPEPVTYETEVTVTYRVRVEVENDGEGIDPDDFQSELPNFRYAFPGMSGRFDSASVIGYPEVSVSTPEEVIA